MERQAEKAVLIDGLKRIIERKRDVLRSVGRD
jgi:hypothetical protein